MELRARSLGLEAGKNIAILHSETAKTLAVYVGERIRIRKNNKTAIAIIDIARGIFGHEEIALSTELVQELNVRDYDIVDVSTAPRPESIEYIRRKLRGEQLDYKQIYKIIADITNKALTESEIAYFVSASYIKGMSLKEIAFLAKAMVENGKRLELKGKVFDKHGCGGIAGNRTTPIIVSICSSAGMLMPKTSSKAITSAAGTADVIECFAKVEFNIEEIKKILVKANACMVWGGSLNLAPADDKIIQVERLLSLDPEPQLIASILAKKLAVNANSVLLDVPYGKSAKVTKEKASLLKNKFLAVAKMLGLNVTVAITNGEQPIGNGIGPMLEAIDVLSVLKQEEKRPFDLEEKSIMLAGILLEIAKKARKGKGKELAKKILESGNAYGQFSKIMQAQEGDAEKKLGYAKFCKEIKAEKSGIITDIDNKKIASIARASGCPADKRAGIYLLKHLNEKAKKNEEIMKIYAETKEKLDYATDVYKKLMPIKIS